MFYVFVSAVPMCIHTVPIPLVAVPNAGAHVFVALVRRTIVYVHGSCRRCFCIRLVPLVVCGAFGCVCVLRCVCMRLFIAGVQLFMYMSPGLRCIVVGLSFCFLHDMSLCACSVCVM